MSFDTGNDVVIEYMEQTVANLRSLDWYVFCDVSAMPFEKNYWTFGSKLVMSNLLRSPKATVGEKDQHKMV